MSIFLWVTVEDGPVQKSKASHILRKKFLFGRVIGLGILMLWKQARFCFFSLPFLFFFESVLSSLKSDVSRLCPALQGSCSASFLSGLRFAGRVERWGIPLKNSTSFLASCFNFPRGSRSQLVVLTATRISRGTGELGGSFTCSFTSFQLSKTAEINILFLFLWPPLNNEFPWGGAGCFLDKIRRMSKLREFTFITGGNVGPPCTTKKKRRNNKNKQIEIARKIFNA